MSNRNLSPVDRFWSHVNKTDYCWEWTASKYPFGYGCFKANGKKFGAHRFSWILANGPILYYLFVLHKCDNPSCVNPDHLFLGTQRANMRDRMKKWRHVYGEKSKASKLTESQVFDIWKNKNSENAGIVAKRYNVSRSCIQAIWVGKNWRWLTSSFLSQ